MTTGKGQPWITDYFKHIEKMYTSKTPSLSTGYDVFDGIFQGLRPGTLTVLGGRPSMGKSFTVLNFLSEASKKKTGLHAAYLSTDGCQEDGALKYLAIKSDVPSYRLCKGLLSKQDWPRVAMASGTIAESNVVLSADPRLDFERLNAYLDARPELELLIIDSLHMMVPAKRDVREQEVTSIVQELKRIAVERNIPVIATANLNRQLEMRQDKRPLLSDLRDSGAIEDHANNVIFIYRDEYYIPPEVTRDWQWMELIVAKGSPRELDSCGLIYYRETGRLILPTTDHFEKAA